MKAFLFFTMMAAGIFSAFSQDRVDDILVQIEQNNTTLAAIRTETDALKTGNRTGLLPPNPEVEFSYLWGNPSPVGNRTDFSVLQSFDFPTVYTYRSEIASLKNEQVELEYLKQRNELFHETRMLLAALTYHNALLAEYSERLQHAEQLASGYQRMLEVGEANILDYNKAMVNRLSLAKELERMTIERRTLLAKLERLNGGVAIQFTDSTFDNLPLIADFEQWVENAGQSNPALLQMNQEMSVAEKQVQLNKALSLPKLKAGYMSEKVVGEQFQGITAGISIPLWESKNTVKHARAKSEAVARQLADARFQFYNELKNLHRKAVSLHKSTLEYHEQLQDYNNKPLLEKAHNAGQISLSEYLLGMAVYYQSMDNLLQMNHEALVARYSMQRFY